MKKTLCVMMLAMFATATVQAAVYEETFNVSTNAAVVSAVLPIAGTLDKVEVIQSAGVTNTIVIATYTGTTAVDTLVGLTDLTGNKVVRPRIIGTTTAGVNLAAAIIADATNTVGTVLVAPFERPYIAGNVKATLTANAANGTTASTITLRFYFTRN
jgi:hypothetical protein